jgi:predicted ChrR family anti-sigma factor
MGLQAGETVTHPHELLPELALGTLAAPERVEVERHVQACPACAEKLAGEAQLLTVVGASLEEAAPSRALRDRVFASVEGPRRFEPLLEAASALLRVNTGEVLEVFAQADHPRGWLTGPSPGLRVRPVRLGPSLGQARGWLLAMPPGGTYPHHRHEGDEEVLVLQGSYRDDQGRTATRGQRLREPAGSAHQLQALEGPECICLVVVHPAP